MPLWNRTANQLVEKRNNFLRDLAHGVQVIYRTTQTTGGTWDNVTETMVGATVQDVDVDYGKAALVMPVKSINDADSGNEHASAVAGIKITGIDMTKVIVCRFHTKVPLNLEATYLIGGRPHRLTKVLSNVFIGALPCWNEVMLVEA